MSNGLMRWMREAGIKATRESYINAEYDYPLPEWNAELEGELP